MTDTGQRDHAEEAYQRKHCDACGTSPCQWDGTSPDEFHGAPDTEYQAPEPSTEELSDGDRALTLAETAGFKIVHRVVIEDSNRYAPVREHTILKHTDGRELRVITEPDTGRFYLAQGTNRMWSASARQITSVAALKRELGPR